MSQVLAGILQGRHPADVNFRSPARAETAEQEPASFLIENPIAQIEQAHVFSPGNSPDDSGLLTESPNGNSEDQTPIKETVVFRPGSVGKRYIKHPELTNPPMG